MRNPNCVIVEHFSFIMRQQSALMFFILLRFPCSSRVEGRTVWDSVNVVVIVFAFWYFWVCLQNDSVCFHKFTGSVFIPVCVCVCAG